MMPPLPPLECLRFFEAAARHESFVCAAEELQVTPPAVAYRVKVLENHIGHPLFDRSRRGLKLNLRGQACLRDVQCLLTEITAVMDRHRTMPTKRRLRVVAIESLAERWLMPKVAAFTAVRPDLAITLETDHVRGAPNRADFDLWITYDGEAGTPNVKILRREKLFEEPLFPVCSPQLLKTRGQPPHSTALRSWPLLYHLGWPADWSSWFTAQGSLPPDLSNASGFRLCSLLIHAATAGLGVALGRPTLIAPELQQGVLVPVFNQADHLRTRCCLITTEAASREPHVQAFRRWLLQTAAQERVEAPARTTRRTTRST